jgi:hypothetical protein
MPKLPTALVEKEVLELARTNKSKRWTAFVTVIDAIAAFAASGIPGDWPWLLRALVAAGAAFLTWLLADWIQDRWRAYHTVPLSLLNTEVLQLRAEKVSGNAQIECAPEMMPDHPVRAVLRITNHSEADDFQAQIMAWGEGDRRFPAAARSLRWAKNGAEVVRIFPGQSEYLEIARLQRSPSPPGRPDGPRGVVSVLVDWESRGSLLDSVYWDPEDFQTSIWSLEIVISASRRVAPLRQGVRLHVFGKAADDPTGKVRRYGWGLQAPTIRLSLF